MNYSLLHLAQKNDKSVDKSQIKKSLSRRHIGDHYFRGP